MSSRTIPFTSAEKTYAEYAKQYAELGIVPIPFPAGKKSPIVDWARYQKGITNDEIEELSKGAITEKTVSQTPTKSSAKVGDRTGNEIGGVCPVGSAYFVLDLDDGAYDEMHEKYGFELPTNTPVARSGGVCANGKREKYHIYYARGIYSNIIKSTSEHELDFFSSAKVGVRADTLFTVLPPSKHPSGNLYEWLTGQAPWEMDMVEPDEVVSNMLLIRAGRTREDFKPAFKRKTDRELRRMVEHDNRDTYLHGLLGWARTQKALGFDIESPDRDLLYAYAESVNNKFAEPLSDSQLSTNVNSSLKEWQKAADATAETTVVVNGKAYEISEVGLAERLADALRDKARYAPARKAWLAYDGHYWVTKEKGDNSAVLAALRPISRELPAEANSIPDETLRNAIRKRLIKLKEAMGSVTRHGHVATYAASLNTVDNSALDAVPDVLNLQNGTLSLSDYTLRPHAPADMLTKIADVAYDPEAQCPRWASFLLESLGGDMERVSYLQRALGYALTDNCDHQKFFILHGLGNNGKSVIVNVIGRMLGLMGTGYGCPAKITSFLATRGTDDRIGNDILDMASCRFTFVEEPRKDVRLNDGLIKDLAAGGPQAGRRLHENLIRFNFQAKLFFVCNHLPILNDTGKGLERRVIVIPFGKGIDDASIDIHLTSKLMDEASGILNWLLAGHRALVIGGAESLKPAACAAVLEATRHYIKDNDLLGQFIEDCCTVGPDERVGTTLFRGAYEAWITENAYDRVPTDAKRVKAELSAKGFNDGKLHGGIMHFIGIGVQPEWIHRGDEVARRRGAIPYGTDY